MRHQIIPITTLQACTCSLHQLLFTTISRLIYICLGDILIYQIMMCNSSMTVLKVIKPYMISKYNRKIKILKYWHPIIHNWLMRHLKLNLITLLHQFRSNSRNLQKEILQVSLILVRYPSLNLIQFSISLRKLDSKTLRKSKIMKNSH